MARTGVRAALYVLILAVFHINLATAIQRKPENRLRARTLTVDPVLTTTSTTTSTSTTSGPGVTVTSTTTSDTTTSQTTTTTTTSAATTTTSVVTTTTTSSESTTTTASGTTTTTSTVADPVSTTTTGTTTTTTTSTESTSTTSVTSETTSSGQTTSTGSTTESSTGDATATSTDSTTTSDTSSTTSESSSTTSSTSEDATSTSTSESSTSTSSSESSTITSSPTSSTSTTTTTTTTSTTSGASDPRYTGAFFSLTSVFGFLGENGGTGTRLDIVFRVQGTFTLNGFGRLVSASGSIWYTLNDGSDQVFTDSAAAGGLSRRQAPLTALSCSVSTAGVLACNGANGNVFYTDGVNLYLGGAVPAGFSPVTIIAVLGSTTTTTTTGTASPTGPTSSGAVAPYPNWGSWDVIPGSSGVPVPLTTTVVLPGANGLVTQTITVTSLHCGCTETPVPTKIVMTTYVTDCPESWGYTAPVTVTVPVKPTGAPWGGADVYYECDEEDDVSITEGWSNIGNNGNGSKGSSGYGSGSATKTASGSSSTGSGSSSGSGSTYSKTGGSSIVNGTVSGSGSKTGGTGSGPVVNGTSNNWNNWNGTPYKGAASVTGVNTILVGAIAALASLLM